VKAGELVVDIGLLGLPVAIRGINDLTKGLRGVAGEAFKAFATVTSLIGAFGALATVNGDVGARLQRFSDLTGESTQDLQKWEQTLLGVNVSIGETDAALLKVKDAFNVTNRVQNVSKLASILGQAGVRIAPELLNTDRYTSSQVFGYLASLRKQVKSSQARSQFRLALEDIFGQNVAGGILDPRFKGLQNSPLVVSDSNIKKLAEMRAGIEKLKQELQHSFNSFLLTHFGEVRDVAKQIIDLIPAFLQGLGKVVTVAAHVAKIWLNLAKDHQVVVKALGAITGAFLLLKSPVLLIAGAIVGIVDGLKYLENFRNPNLALASSADSDKNDTGVLATLKKVVGGVFGPPSAADLPTRIPGNIGVSGNTVISNITNNVAVPPGTQNPTAFGNAVGQATGAAHAKVLQPHLNNAHAASTGKGIVN
jgi:hypothetical protein